MGPVKVYFFKGVPKREGSDIPVLEALLKSKDVTFEEWYEPPYDPEKLAKLLELNTTHFRACVVKARDAAGIGYRLTTDTGEDPPKDEERAVKDFIHNINPHRSFFDILESLVLDYESIGWGCLEIIRNRRGQVIRVEHVPSKDVRVLKDRTYASYVQLNGEDRTYFQAFPDKRNRYIHARRNTPNAGWSEAANELIFWAKPHPAVRYYGLPDIIPALGDILATNKLRDYFIDFFENNCMARHAIIIKGGAVSEETREEIEAYFRNELKGSAHRTIVMEVDEDTTVEIRPLDVEQKEADFRETRKDLRDFILLAHGVMPAQVGVIETANLGSGQGLSQAETHLNRIVIPLQRALHGILDRILRENGIRRTHIRLIPPDIRDIDVQTRSHERMLKLSVVSPNETRRMVFGLPGYSGGERHFISGRSILPRYADREKPVDEVGRNQPEELEPGV